MSFCNIHGRGDPCTDSEVGRARIWPIARGIAFPSRTALSFGKSLLNTRRVHLVFSHCGGSNRTMRERLITSLRWVPLIPVRWFPRAMGVLAFLQRGVLERNFSPVPCFGTLDFHTTAILTTAAEAREESFCRLSVHQHQRIMNVCGPSR